MNSINLQELYDTAQRDLAGKILRSDSVEGRVFGKKIKEIVAEVPEFAGVYLWVQQTREKRASVYVGEAQNIRSRLRESLSDERALFWASIIEKSKLFAIGRSHYEDHWSDYQFHWQRAIRKAGATHIYWYSAQELEPRSTRLKVESWLIQHFHPSANAVTAEPTDVSDLVTKAISAFSVVN